ncbi:hypothetical protein ACLX1H_011294 [Fusarium chlamydosporum]
MHFSTILPVITVALGAANAAPVDDGIVEPRQHHRPHERELLKLYGVPKIGEFHGVGFPNRCYNLPRNVNDFDHPEATSGYKCKIYTKKHCRGSYVPVPVDDKHRHIVPPDEGDYRSWRCTWD